MQIRLTLIELPPLIFVFSSDSVICDARLQKKNTDGKYVIRISVNNLCRAVALWQQALFLFTLLSTILSERISYPSPCSCGVFYLPTGGVEVEMFGI